jgi:hypothetical protein
MDLVGDTVDSRSLEFLLDSLSKQGFTSGIPDIHDTFLRVRRRFDHGDGTVRRDALNESSVVRREVGKSDDVNLVDDQDDRLVEEERLDRVEQLALDVSNPKHPNTMH